MLQTWVTDQNDINDTNTESLNLENPGCSSVPKRLLSVAVSIKAVDDATFLHRII